MTQLRNWSLVSRTSVPVKPGIRGQNDPSDTLFYPETGGRRAIIPRAKCTFMYVGGTLQGDGISSLGANIGALFRLRGSAEGVPDD